jgi:hypothetical protein
MNEQYSSATELILNYETGRLWKRRDIFKVLRKATEMSVRIAVTQDWTADLSNSNKDN